MDNCLFSAAHRIDGLNLRASWHSVSLVLTVIVVSRSGWPQEPNEPTSIPSWIGQPCMIFFTSFDRPWLFIWTSSAGFHLEMEKMRQKLWTCFNRATSQDAATRLCLCCPPNDAMIPILETLFFLQMRFLLSAVIAADLQGNESKVGHARKRHHWTFPEPRNPWAILSILFSGALFVTEAAWRFLWHWWEDLTKLRFLQWGWRGKKQLRVHKTGMCTFSIPSHFRLSWRQL